MSDHRARLLHGQDDARQRATDLLDGVTIRVLLDEPTWSRAELTTTLVDLLARLFPRIDVRSTDEEVIREAQAARSRGGLVPLPPGSADLTIAVGPSAEGDVYVDASGWMSYLGGGQPAPFGNADEVPYGALVGAARGAAHVVDRVLDPEGASTPASVYSSCWSYRAQADPFFEDHHDSVASLDHLLIGAGSIGGAAVYAFARHRGLGGSLGIVDPDHLEGRNVVKAILADVVACAASEAKAEAARSALAHLDSLSTRSFTGTAQEFRATLDPYHALPAVLCAVDSPASRREIQDMLPLELLNAACHPREVTISRHITGDGPCICCLQMADVLDDSRIHARLISNDTGLTFMDVVTMLNDRRALDRSTLDRIALARGLPFGALSHFEGSTLDQLWAERFRYAEAEVGAETGVAVIATACVTALAGFLLAGEAVKPPRAAGALGPGGLAIKYDESPYSSPLYALFSSPERWSGSECLCRSARRERLTAAIYHANRSPRSSQP